MMIISWDGHKASLNLKKHEISFDEAATVLLSESALRFEDPRHEEQRFIAIGYSSEARVLMVVYCYRLESEIRIISARRAR